MSGLRSTFAFNAARLPNLVDVSEPDGIYRNRFHHEHAERYFWLKYLPSIKMPIGQYVDIEGRGMFYHPLNKLIKHTEAHYPGRIEQGGEVYVIEDELPEEARYEHDGDTLLHGFIDGDTLQGIWTFRVQEQYGFKDEESFHLNLSAELPDIPMNGKWELKYLGGNTAISGVFKNGLKEGEWLFYNELGELVCKRYFHADTLQRTIVNFHMRGNLLQSRAYFFSPNASIQSFENNNKVSFIYIDLWKDEKDPLVITNQSISIMNNAGNYTIYNRNHPKFDRIFRETVIDKVYPEYTGQELPFSY
jgi:antitoxin component YwqK of YwqJK toxin-antitoxin module